MNASVRAVVLDIDDTLYLERDYVHSGFRHVDHWCAKKLGIRGVGDRAWHLFEAGVRGSMITDALSSLGVAISPQLRAAVIAAYRTHSPSIELLPDARDFLSRIHGRVPVAVLTDGPTDSQRAKVRTLRLDRWADPIVLTADLGSSKPDPRMFAAAVAGLRVPPGAIVYIADNPAKDFAGPLTLGWRAVRVRRLGSLHEAVQTPPGVAEVADLWEQTSELAVPLA